MRGRENAVEFFRIPAVEYLFGEVGLCYVAVREVSREAG
jgi:hypothetical protein